MHGYRTNHELIAKLDGLHASIAGLQREFFEFIVEADRRQAWRDSGCRDLPHWLSIRYGISWWKAHRWVGAAHALRRLPRLADAFQTGELGIDKVVELARFATADTESALLRWAQGVSVSAVRRRADLAHHTSVDEVRDADRARSLSWWYCDQGRRFGLEAELPASEGAAVARAIERMAGQTPVMPGEEDPSYASARRADALVALCSSAIAADHDPDRATVIVHAPLDALVSGEQGCEIEGGGVAHPQTVRRLLCTARVQAVIEDRGGNPLGLGRTSREPSASMMRQLRYRDCECRFPGCGTRRFIQAHHIKWWEHGGRTDLNNLLLVCTFHHKLVHEYGWAVTRDEDSTVRWFRPGGTLYRAGPAPPEMREAHRALAAVG